MTVTIEHLPWVVLGLALVASGVVWLIGKALAWLEKRHSVAPPPGGNSPTP